MRSTLNRMKVKAKTVLGRQSQLRLFIATTYISLLGCNNIESVSGKYR